MSLTVDRTADEILVRSPISSTPMQVQNALNFLRYVALGQGSQITEEDIAALVIETSSYLASYPYKTPAHPRQ